LAMAAGFAACDNGSPAESAGGPHMAGTTSTGTGGSGTPQGGATSSGGTSGANLPGIALDPMMGWVNPTNDAKIQGALFSFGDDTSKMGMTENFMGSNACIKGTAAKVDLACTPKPPDDCYGATWGVAIGLNLNQTTDPVTMMGGTAMAYDATNLKGVYFDVEGETIPGPTDFRFKVENGSKEFCTPKTKKVVKGPNTILFSDLMAECWHTTDPANATVTPDVQAALIKISWQVVTNSGNTVPFDFCISDIRVLPKDGTNGTPPGYVAAGGTTGAGGAATGGTSAGGTSAGGTAAGGASTGGGGSSAGGTSAGGASAGGPAAGSGGAKAGSGGSGG